MLRWSWNNLRSVFRHVFCGVFVGLGIIVVVLFFPRVDLVERRERRYILTQNVLLNVPRKFSEIVPCMCTVTDIEDSVQFLEGQTLLEQQCQQCNESLIWI